MSENLTDFYFLRDSVTWKHLSVQLVFHFGGGGHDGAECS